MVAVAVPLGYALIGPAVSMVGSWANAGITAMMHTVPLLASALFGALYQVMVLFGIHSALTSFSFMNLCGRRSLRRIYHAHKYHDV